MSTAKIEELGFLEMGCTSQTDLIKRLITAKIMLCMMWTVKKQVDLYWFVKLRLENKCGWTVTNQSTIYPRNTVASSYVVKMSQIPQVQWSLMKLDSRFLKAKSWMWFKNTITSYSIMCTINQASTLSCNQSRSALDT